MNAVDFEKCFLEILSETFILKFCEILLLTFEFRLARALVQAVIVTKMS